MNQINIEEALGSGGLSPVPMDTAGGTERVINKVSLYMPYILQSLMISCFPLAIHYCYCLRGQADRKWIRRHCEAHLSTDNWQPENYSAAA